MKAIYPRVDASSHLLSAAFRRTVEALVEPGDDQVHHNSACHEQPHDDGGAPAAGSSEGLEELLGTG